MCNMKKFLSLIALAVALVGCKPGQGGTTFTKNPAEATIEVSAVDVNAPDTKLSASEYQVSNPSMGTVEGNLIKIKGTPEIAATTVTFNVVYKGKTYSGSAPISALAADAKASFTATVVVGENETPQPPVGNAKATIVVTATDINTGAVVNDKVELSATAGTVEGNVITIEDKTIAATDVEVTAKYEGKDYKETVKVAALGEGESKVYSLVITVGEKTETPDPEENAQATISVVAVDATTSAVITDSIKVASSVGTVSGNVITVVGAPAIDSTLVKVDVTYQEKVYSDSLEIAVPAGEKAAYQLIVNVGEGGAPSVSVSYSVVLVESFVSVQNEYWFNATNTHNGIGHAYSHSHNGIDNWFTNESDFILNVSVEYTDWKGVDPNSVKAEVLVAAHEEGVENAAAALKNSGFSKEKATYTAKISAWALYTFQQVVTTTTEVYNVVAKVEGEEDAVVGKVTLGRLSNVVRAHETGMPSHDEYHYGHGTPSHGHDHGHGFGNAGGGIIDSE